MPAVESSNHLERHMAYSQHQGKTGPSRAGPPPHLVPHHAPHPPPSASYGPPPPPPPQHGSHPGYGHHVPPPNQRGPPMPSGPQNQMGPQVGQGNQQRSQMGPGMQHGPPPPHGSHSQRGPPGMIAPHGVPGPPHAQHKMSGPHGQYMPHIPHGAKLPSDRPDIPNAEMRHPPAYPEPPRYPGSSGMQEDSDKQQPPAPAAGGPQGQPPVKQYPGNLGGLSGGSGPSMNSVNNSGSGGVSADTAKLEEELSALNRNELIGKALRIESEVRDLKHSFHQQAGELRHLRDSHQRLTDDNQELRDLCCFLDDDRQKGRKLAREWQRFGRYTASVMRQEVTAYQNKLRELDTKQQELIKDNLELKELCLYLDEERNNAACSHCGHPMITRDDGDGSSSSTNADEPSGPPPAPTQTVTQSSTSVSSSSEIPLARSSSRERLLEDTLSRQRSPMNEQVMSYIRSLEARVVLLETEKQQLVEELTKVDRTHPEGEVADCVEVPFPQLKDKQLGSRPPQPPPYSFSHHLRAVGLGLTNRAPLGPGSAESDDELLDGPPPPPLVSRPTAVAAAMRVLELQEQLDGSSHPSGAPPHSQGPPPPPLPGGGGSNVTCPDSELADGEKALLRQMCNVVWKKLEEVPSQHR
ncbi:coiled-coil domain-containing protein 85C [Macrobrachium rosenbergii]|uniref:coiled-coil domain-containing protein 85C n=1 Tax=Macrobrachium rosenbergii TaxID=79674 RepID=UPI0034D61C02